MIDVSEVKGISKHQRKQLGEMLSGRIGILGGGPGTGKTYCLAKLLTAMKNSGHGAGVAVVAPTGKAAVRITEYLQAEGLSLTATTIHRLLGVAFSGMDSGSWEFRHNARNPLPTRILFIDESSMLSTTLLDWLLDACCDSIHIYFIGDVHQLPPVEHGAPLRDMIAAGVPYGELTEIRRNSGDGVAMCHAIKTGATFEPSGPGAIEDGNNVKHNECRFPGKSLEAIKRLIMNPPASVDPVDDIQVVTPLNDKGPISRVELNKVIQSWLNPGKNPISDKFPIRVRDKVICKTNCFLQLWDEENRKGDEDEDAKDFVANGEIGRVTSIFKEKSKNGSTNCIVVKFDSPNRSVISKGEGLFNFELAYAITVHKSQGSSWPIVIYMVDETPSARRVCSRELVYTALSRFEKVIFTIGRLGTLRSDCRIESLKHRKTFLREMIG